MKILLKVVICIVLVTVALESAYAQFAKPEYAIKYRKSVMFLIAQHFGRMGAMVKEQVPYDQQVFVNNAKLVKTFSSLPWEASMVPGTDSGNTTLNAEVFMKPAEFKEVAQNFETQTAKLASIARSGDLIGIKTQFGEVAKSCKACHSQFRTK